MLFRCLHQGLNSLKNARITTPLPMFSGCSANNGVQLNTILKDNNDAHCNRGFHTSDCRNKHKSKKRKSWKDIPQPALKPIGPEDYQRWRYYLNQPAIQEKEIPQLDRGEDICNEVFDRVNQQIIDQSYGRLFAVVHISGKQFKVTTEDIIVILNHFNPLIGETILLEKVLLVGGSDFTLIGKPLLNKELVRVEATVIEKTLSHIMPRFTFIKRAHHRRISFQRIPFTMLRINSIDLRKKVNTLSDVEGIENRILV